MRACFRCYEIKNCKEFSFNKWEGNYNYTCKKCNREIYSIKRKAIGKRDRNQQKEDTDKKYEKVVNFKKQNPQVCLPDICNLYGMNHWAVKEYMKKRKILIKGSDHRKLKYAHLPKEKRWLWPSTLAKQRAYIKLPHARLRRSLYNKKYFSKYPERKRIYNNKSYRKSMINLSDSYIRTKILARDSNLKRNQFPKCLVDAKRDHLKLLRIIKQHETNK